MKRFALAALVAAAICPGLARADDWVPGREVGAEASAPSPAPTTGSSDASELPPAADAVVVGNGVGGQRAEARISCPTRSTHLVVVRVEVAPKPASVGGRGARPRTVHRRVYVGPRLSGQRLVNLLRKEGFFATQAAFAKLAARVDGVERRLAAVETALKGASGRLDDHERRIAALERAGAPSPPPVAPAPSPGPSGSLAPAVPAPAPNQPASPPPPAGGGLRMIPAVYNRGGVWENGIGRHGEPIARLRLVDDAAAAAAAPGDPAGADTEKTITVTGDGQPLAGVEILVYQGDDLVGSQRTGAKGQMRLEDASGLSQYAIALGQLPGGWRSDGTSRWTPEGDLEIALVSAAADHASVVGRLDAIAGKLDGMASHPTPAPTATSHWGWVVAAIAAVIALAAAIGWWWVAMRPRRSPPPAGGRTVEWDLPNREDREDETSRRAPPPSLGDSDPLEN